MEQVLLTMDQAVAVALVVLVEMEALQLVEVLVVMVLEYHRLSTILYLHQDQEQDHKLVVDWDHLVLLVDTMSQVVVAVVVKMRHQMLMH